MADDIKKLVEARVAAEQNTVEAPEVLKELSDFDITRCAKESRAGDAAIFIHYNYGKFMYVRRLREWYRWVGHYWEKDIDAAYTLAAVEVVVDQYRRTVSGWWRQLNPDADPNTPPPDSTEMVVGDEKESKKDNVAQRNIKALNQKITQLHDDAPRGKVLNYARTCKDTRLVIDGQELDTQPWLLACPNAVINLKTGEAKPGQPAEYQTCAVPTPWLGLDEPCPNFEAFLSASLGEDKQLLAYMQRMLGHALIGRQREHVFLVLSGAKGRNGKGTLMKTLEQILGPTIMAPVPSEMLLDQGYAKSSGGPAVDVMSLKGLRIAYASETDEGRKFSSAKVKWLSGGDRLVARGMYGSEMTYWDSTHTLILLTNDLPHAKADDQAFWSRVHLVPFRYSFLPNPNENNEFEKKADPDLQEKLKAEASGILAWLVRGCLAYLDGGLAPPPQVAEATKEYRDSEDLVGRFIGECCLVGDGRQIQSSELYDAFSSWYEQEVSKRREFSNKRFSEILAKKGYEKRKISSMYWIGLDISDDFKQQLEQSQKGASSDDLWDR